jgi:outer membrane biosynthesis protein TonB
MLRMVLLGLLIPLGVGVLSAMELGTPSRGAVATVQAPAETAVGVSDSRGALAKADRLEVAAASSETPAPPALVEERVSPPQDTRVDSSPAKPIKRQRHDPKPKKVTVAATPKSKPKAADIKVPDIKAADLKRTAVSRPSRAASDTGPCRLKAFGGLLRALGSADCEI